MRVNTEICINFPPSLFFLVSPSFTFLIQLLYSLPLLLISVTFPCLPYSFFPLSFSSFLPISLPGPLLYSPSLSCYASLSFPPSISPRPDWWCVEVRQTDGGWGIAPASLWHWASFRPGKMIDVKSNFKHPQFNSGRQTESGGQRLATQLGQPDKT